MKTIALKWFVPSLMSLALCLFATSCDTGGVSKSLEKTKRATAGIKNKINDKNGWKTLSAVMADNFEFRDAEGNVKKGDKKEVGGKPFLSSIHQPGFAAYEQKITDARDLGGGVFEIDVDATLKIKTPSGDVKTAKWPACFSWTEKNGELTLTAVEYVDAMEWTAAKAPPPKPAPAPAPTADKEKEHARPYATQKNATENSNRVGDHSAGTCLKVKRSIQNQVEQFNRINRSGNRK